MTVIAMSRTEIDRMHVLRDMVTGRITANEAAQLMRLTRRQVFRLAKAYRERGPSALVSTRRGQPSNHRYPAALRTETLGLITANYADFGRHLPARSWLSDTASISGSRRSGNGCWPEARCRSFRRFSLRVRLRPLTPS